MCLTLAVLPSISDSGKQASARDGDAAIVPPEPEDLPPPRRGDVCSNGGGARGQADRRAGEPEPVGAPREEPDTVQFGYDAYAKVERWWANGGPEQIDALALPGTLPRARL